MSLPHAILGLLNYEAMTGYDLKRRWFDQSMRYFWPADQAQIYRTLDSLVSQGWAAFTVEPGGDRPNRKVYALTDAGREELTHWLATPAPLPVVRDPLLVKLFSADPIADATIVDLLRARRADRIDRLASYQEVAAGLPQVSTGRQRKLWEAVVGSGIAAETAAIGWLDQQIANFSDEAPDTDG